MALACQTAQSRNLVLISLENPVKYYDHKAKSNGAPSQFSPNGISWEGGQEEDLLAPEAIRIGAE